MTSTYCLVMDSGAAWHITGEVVERCPNDGCDLRYAHSGGLLPDEDEPVQEGAA